MEGTQRVSDREQETSLDESREDLVTDDDERVGEVQQQASVVFAGADIAAVLGDDGLVYGALPHLCRALRLDADRQRERIDEQPALARGLRRFPLTQSLASGGTRLIATWCLRADLVPYWLAIVPTRRMKPERRERIDRYQTQVADVLARLFGSLPPQATDPQLLTIQHPVFAEGLAVARLALDEAQRAARQAHSVEEALASASAAIEARLMALEERLLPRATLSEEQAEQISDLVKQVALALASRAGGGNFFGTVYGQLYRAFGITSYKNLTQAQYPLAVRWLEKRLDGDVH
jgi:hypothetical protein